MDNGGYKFIYNDDVYQILDEGEYFAVDKDYRQIAAFKTSNAAFEYVNFLLNRYPVV